MGRKKKKERPVLTLGIKRVDSDSEDQSTNRAASTRSRWIASMTPAVVLLVGGIIYGVQTNRWVESHELAQASERLEQVPLNFGDWEGTDIPFSERQLEGSGATGYVSREYRHRITKRRIHVMLLCGPHGPVSLHPPTVCFVGAGWKVEKIDKKLVTTSEEKSVGEFQVGTFVRNTTSGVLRMRTLWAWKADDDWTCPNRPRIEFAGRPYLYKIYVSSTKPAVLTNRQDKTTEDDECEKFLREFNAHLRKAGI